FLGPQRVGAAKIGLVRQNDEEFSLSAVRGPLHHPRCNLGGRGGILRQNRSAGGKTESNQSEEDAHRTENHSQKDARVRKTASRKTLFVHNFLRVCVRKNSIDCCYPRAKPLRLGWP